MKNTLINISFSIICLLILLPSCIKEANTTISDPKFTLSGKLYEKGVLLTWAETSLPNFQHYIIVRSKSPLASNYVPIIESNLVIFKTANQNFSDFVDENLPIVEDLYYTLYVDLGNRFLKSAEITVKSGYYFWDSPAFNINSSYNPVLNLLYVFHANNSENQLSVFDMKAREILATTTYPLSFVNDQTAFSKASGINEFYVGKPESGIGMICEVLDAHTLEVKNSFLLTENFGNLKLATNHLGHLCYKGIGQWKILNPSDSSLFAMHNSVKDSDFLFNLDNDDLQFLSIGDDRMDYVKFDGTGNVSGIEAKTLDKILSYKMAVSPDGQTFLAYQDGSVFNKDLEKIGQLGNGEINYEIYHFSTDGSKIFAKEQNLSTIKQYNAADLQWEKDFDFTYSINNFFIDGEDMIIVGLSNGEMIIHDFDYTL